MATAGVAPPKRRRPSRRAVLALAVVAAATLIGVFVFRGSHPVIPATYGPGPTGPEMLRHPLDTRVTSAKAAVALGEPVVLPDTSFVGPADLGGVWGIAAHDWAVYHQTEGEVAVTFPAQRVFINYQVPRIGSPSGFAKEMPEASVIHLTGTPALAIPQDPAKQQFGVIAFGVGGTGIQVYGPYDEGTLAAIAQSILDRYHAQPPQKPAGIEPVDWTNPPPGTTADSVAAAAASLAFPPVLPRRLGSPVVFVDRGRGELALVYDRAADKKYWLFNRSWVTERLAGSTTTAGLRGIANACVAKGGCGASTKMISMRDGREGLLVTGATTTRLIWVDGGIRFEVLQPSNGGNGREILSVANWFILAKER